MPNPTVKNLFADLPAPQTQEWIETLAANSQCRVERIVSDGQSSPPGFWYDQAETEWVVVLKGEGRLEFEDGGKLTLKPGDSLLIPPHYKHRVDYTSREERTIWLAVFLKSS